MALDLNKYYTQSIHLTDRIMPSLQPSEQLVLLQIFSRTVGVGEDNCRLSHAILAELTGFGLRTIQNALKSLIDKGLITVVSPGKANTPSVYRFEFPVERQKLTRYQRDPEYILGESKLGGVKTTGIVARLDARDKEMLDIIMAELSPEEFSDYRRKAKEVLKPGESLDTKIQELVLLNKFGSERLKKYTQAIAVGFQM